MANSMQLAALTRMEKEKRRSKLKSESRYYAPATDVALLMLLPVIQCSMVDIHQATLAAYFRQH